MKAESAWLIESKGYGDRSTYWVGGHGWSFVPDKAVRFARREDALKVSQTLVAAYPVEHRWVTIDNRSRRFGQGIVDSKTRHEETMQSLKRADDGQVKQVEPAIALAEQVVRRIHDIYDPVYRGQCERNEPDSLLGLVGRLREALRERGECGR
jgi:hypothetical protein